MKYILKSKERQCHDCGHIVREYHGKWYHCLNIRKIKCYECVRYNYKTKSCDADDCLHGNDYIIEKKKRCYCGCGNPHPEYTLVDRLLFKLVGIRV